ncbi:MAG: type II toxin-antitoxin system VapC family toxin [Bryobacterales bacterium]|nr:type II toxin-antitoxin system VapC family toxin [Bryobacterales bacterium]
MRVLLDTQVLLWAAGSPERLSDDIRDLVENSGTELVFSAESIWEVAIKNGLGRRDFRVDPRLLRRGLLENDYVELAGTGEHAATVDILPPIHKDPFHRILVTQAMAEGITLITADPVVARYPGPIRAFDASASGPGPVRH